MLLRARPVELLDQIAMDPGRGHADVVQHAEVEQEIPLLLAQAKLRRTLGRHDADALAMRDIVHADEVERIGQRVDHTAKVGVDAHGQIRRVMTIPILPIFPFFRDF